MVGFAKTVTIRARDKVSGPSYMQKRMDYLDYVAAEPRPSVVVIEDKDEPAGYGAFWGEVQTNVHKALGCLGTVTNGSIRDIAQLPRVFRCSPARSHPRMPMCMSVSSAFPFAFTAWTSKRRPHPCRPPRRRRRAGRQNRRDGGGTRRADQAGGRIIAAARAPGATVEAIKAAIRS